MRQVVLDTETTGKKANEGHKIVEFGAVELIDRKPTGRKIQFYINPQRDIPQEAIAIHGITEERVANEPIFAQVAPKIIEFIRDAEILAHNMDFDMKFLNAELAHCKMGQVWDYTKKVTDTLLLSRSLYAGERKHSLDAICDRFQVSREGREFHGALLDSELLAEAYIKMTEGRTNLDIKDLIGQTNWTRPAILRFDTQLNSTPVDAKTILDDLNMQLFIAKKAKQEERVQMLETQIAAQIKANTPRTAHNSFSFIKR